MLQKRFDVEDQRGVEVDGSNQKELDPPLEALIRNFAEALVEDKSLIHVESTTDETGTTVKLNVAPQDLGKVIGKQGRTARSLRTILQSVAASQRRRLFLDIGETGMDERRDGRNQDRGDEVDGYSEGLRV